MGSVIQEDPNSTTYLLKQILAELKTLNGFANRNQQKPAKTAPVSTSDGGVQAAQGVVATEGSAPAPAPVPVTEQEQEPPAA